MENRVEYSYKPTPSNFFGAAFSGVYSSKIYKYGSLFFGIVLLILLNLTDDKVKLNISSACSEAISYSIIICIILLTLPLLFAWFFAGINSLGYKHQGDGKDISYISMEGFGRITSLWETHIKWGCCKSITETGNYIFITGRYLGNLTIYKYLLTQGDLANIKAILAAVPISQKNLSLKGDNMTQTPPPLQPPMQPHMPPQGVRPHRGTMLLIFGIAGLLCCVVFAILAWVMGKGDLKQIREGVMDPAGEGLTKAGMILGMIGTILAIVGLVVWLIAVAVGGASFNYHVGT